MFPAQYNDIVGLMIDSGDLTEAEAGKLSLQKKHGVSLVSLWVCTCVQRVNSLHTEVCKHVRHSPCMLHPLGCVLAQLLADSLPWGPACLLATLSTALSMRSRRASITAAHKHLYLTTATVMGDLKMVSLLPFSAG